MILRVPKYVEDIQPYVPGKPIAETQRELGIRQVIKLASNENPLGPSPKAQKAVAKAASELHRYPDGSGFELKEALVKWVGVQWGEIALGNGSNEIIDQLICTFCEPGQAILTHIGAFIAYQICAQVHGVRTEQISISDELKPSLAEALERIRKNPKIRLVFLANPNNPTGQYLNSKELEEFLEEVSRVPHASPLVVLDYAYWEYVTASDLPDPWVLYRKFPNVVILRTFSKVYGLAGLRVGYGIGRQEIVAQVEKVRQPFNTNSLGLVGATAALDDLSFVKKAAKLNFLGMNYFYKELEKLGVPFWKSQGNFLLIDTVKGFGCSGKEVYHQALKKGVILRPVDNYGLPHTLRITVGTERENKKAIQVLRWIQSHGKR